MADILLTTSQVAERLNADNTTVRLWCRQGRFSGAQQVGRDWVIPESAVDAFEKPKMGRPPKPKADKASGTDGKVSVNASKKKKIRKT